MCRFGLLHARALQLGRGEWIKFLPLPMYIYNVQFLPAFNFNPELQEFQWLEFFAGTHACTSAMRRSGYVAAKFDILFNRKPKHRKSNYMDILSTSGFAFLSCLRIFFK